MSRKISRNFSTKTSLESNQPNSVLALKTCYATARSWSPSQLQLLWLTGEYKWRCPGKKEDLPNEVTTTFQKKGCFKIVDEEVQKLLEQNFVTKVSPEQINHGKPEWHLPLQAVFTPERTTNVRLVYDTSSKGHDGLSLNDHLEKGPNFINSLLDVLAAWRWNEVAFTGDVRKMFNQILVHPDD